jgi:hypothetical protein
VSFDFGMGDIKCTLTGAIDEAKANPGDDITILFDADMSIGPGGGFVEDGYGWKIIPDAGDFNSLTIDGTGHTVQLSSGMAMVPNGIFGIFADNVTLQNLFVYDGLMDADPDGIVVGSGSDNTVINNVTVGITPSSALRGLGNGIEIGGTNTVITGSTISGNGSCDDDAAL